MGYLTEFTWDYKVENDEYSCGHEIPEGAKYCPICGIKIGKELITIIGNWLELEKNNNKFWGIASSPNKWAEEAKWYEYDNEMQELSRAFPTVTFVLTGYGEETGDIWRNWYRNGVIKQTKAEVVFKPNPFDKTK